MRAPRSVVLAWLPVAGYMALIWLLSSRPIAIPIAYMPLRDKGAHALEYALLALLSARAVFRTWPERGLRRALLAAVLLTVTWGFLDELHQAFVPSRNADSADLAADAIGAVIGVAIYALIRRMRGANGRPAE
jgi:VanZ family protein